MKDMLTDKDIQRIGVEVANVIEHNINPQFEGVYRRLDKVEGRLDKIELRMDTEMVTKSYLDEKMGSLEGKLIAQDRKLEKKTDALIGTLVDRRTLTSSDVERLEQARVFPRITS